MASSGLFKALSTAGEGHRACNPKYKQKGQSKLWLLLSTFLELNINYTSNNRENIDHYNTPHLRFLFCFRDIWAALVSKLTFFLLLV